MKLLILVDTRQYAFSEIYQHQLHEVLKKKHDCTYVQIDEFDKIREDYDLIFCALRIRSTISHVKKLARYLDGREVIVQDYDPWVALADDGQYRGGYDVIQDNLNLKRLFIPNRFWSRVAEKKGIKTVVERIGMLPRYCDTNSWENRSTETDFRGSYRDYREKAFNRLIKAGVPVTWNKDFISPYAKFLDHLSNVKIWIQSDNEPTFVDGVSCERNALWPKAIEVLSRGCFLIRDYQEEAEYYEVTNMPTAFLFKDESEILDKINKINNMSVSEKNDRIKETVQMIRKANYYEKIADVMKDWINV